MVKGSVASFGVDDLFFFDISACVGSHSIIQSGKYKMFNSGIYSKKL